MGGRTGLPLVILGQNQGLCRPGFFLEVTETKVEKVMVMSLKDQGLTPKSLASFSIAMDLLTINYLKNLK